MRTKHIHNITNVENFKNQLLIWAQQFDDVVWLDSNNYKQNYFNYDAVLAVDAFTSIQTDYLQGFEKLKEYQTNIEDWIFGYLTYDLKNDVEALKSHNFDSLEFPDLYFFQPKKLFFIKGETLEIQYLNYVNDELKDDLKAIKTSINPIIQQSIPYAWAPAFRNSEKSTTRSKRSSKCRSWVTLTSVAPLART